MSHRCLTFPWWLSTHRLNTVWGRQPRNPTWEHHETSAIRHVLNSVFKILTNPQNTNHLWFFFFPQQIFNEQRQKTRSVPSVARPPENNSIALRSPRALLILFTVLTAQHQKITNPYAGFFDLGIFIYLSARLAHKVMFFVSTLTLRRWKDATTTTPANPSNVPQRGLARGRDLDERGDLKQSLSP